MARPVLAGSYTVGNTELNLGSISFPSTFSGTLLSTYSVNDSYYDVITFTAGSSGSYKVANSLSKQFGDNHTIKTVVYRGGSWVSGMEIAQFSGSSSATVTFSAGSQYTIRCYMLSPSSYTTTKYSYSISIGTSIPIPTTKPDIQPYTPGGWASSLVVNKSSSSVGSTSGSFTDSDTIYVQWAFINNGAAISSTFYIYLYVDGDRKASWSVSGLKTGSYNHTTSGYSLGKLSAGTHKIKIAADPTGVVSESNESNNSVERTITVTRDTSCSQTVHIYFRPGEGSGSMSTVTRTIDICSSSSASYTLPSCSFTRSGYTFAGWQVYNACEASSTNPVRQPGYVINDLCGDLTLTATWKANNPSYTLTLDPNGGTLQGNNFGWANGTTYSADVTVTYGKSSYANLGRAARSGYTFTGWWTSTSGGTRVFDSNGNWIIGSYWNSSKQWIYKGNVYLYAQWRAGGQQTYTLTVDPDGHSLVGNNFGTANGTDQIANLTVTYGKSNYSALGRSDWWPMMEKSGGHGHTFIGWYAADGEQVFDANGHAVVGTYWDESKRWQYRGNLTVYGDWVQGGYTFDGDATWALENDFSLRSGRIGHSQSSSMETTVATSARPSGGTFTVTFRWKVSSESGCDCLIFYVDGVEKARISGDTDWTTMSFTVDYGARVRWTYTKDGSLSRGSDCGWVDGITW
jgi:uncharacterized repeat protein (TIGR02543 family)